jgi:hypothetical protein
VHEEHDYCTTRLWVLGGCGEHNNLYKKSMPKPLIQKPYKKHGLVLRSCISFESFWLQHVCTQFRWKEKQIRVQIHTLRVFKLLWRDQSISFDVCKNQKDHQESKCCVFWRDEEVGVYDNRPLSKQVEQVVGDEAVNEHELVKFDNSTSYKRKNQWKTWKWRLF